MKRLISAAFALALILTVFTACGTTAVQEEKETWIFTDSCGREVELPIEISSVVPSGSLAQMMLFSVCPDKVQSLATALTKTQKQYIDEKYWDLPVTGQFYGGSATVSYEEIIAAAPDVIILSPDANYDEIFTDSTWAGVTAVEFGQVYEVPIGPYNWLDRPPSVQRILGIRWLGNLLYPDVFDYDMVEETQKFYSLFFHYDLTDSEARELMANSTYREE